MDPSKMKVVDLRSELGALGLDTKGNKPALVERLRKALETKTGKALPDSSILDTSTEDADEPSTPKRLPAARTTRRSSSSRLASTPAKPLQVAREEPPEPIEEEVKVSEQYSPGQEDSDSEPSSPVKQPEPKSPPPEPKKAVEPQPVIESPVSKKDDKRTSYDKPEDPEPMDTQEAPKINEQDQDKVEDITEKVSEDKDKGEKGEKMDQDADVQQDKNDNESQDDKDDEEREAEAQRKRELTEEEEWKQLNERLKLRDEERIERERKQAEDDAKKLEEVSKDPVKLNRLKRKQQKKARWSNFYRAVEVTNEMLTLPEEVTKDKKVEVKIAEPEIDENKITLSWYDSDLNQYLELPELNSVVPLTDGAFAHAWAGSRASHGVEGGRVCYEVSVGTVVTTTETTEKEAVASGLRIGWSTTDSSLHLGDGEVSWGFESTGRALHNGEFKEYGKALAEKDVVGAYLDLESNPCKISYTLNGLELGVAFEFDKAVLEGKPLFPHILTKNQCYKVNFGNDRYNMLTKTKLVRTRIEIPVEQVLEEKRRIEEELQKQKDEAARKERERRDRDRKEREERQRKKREERERVERERKEKEDQERRDRGEEVPTEAELAEKEKEKEQEKQQEKEQEKETDKDAEKEKESEQSPVEKMNEEPKENGENPVEVSEKEEPKSVPMETESSEAKTEKDVKAEPVTEVVEITEEQVLKGQVLLDKKIKFVIRYLVEEELDGTEVCLVPGYVLISHADLVEGPPRPASLADCEVILMVGLPGAGKTHWVRAHVAANPAKRYNILSTGALQERMKVDCKPFRATYEGRWDAMVSKCAKCVLKLLEIAKGRRRNFILDQRRKLREFDGYRRVAVVIVTDDETYRDRHKRREEADGKEVPDPAIVDMKANFALPEKCSWLDEVIFPELGEEAARAILEEYHKEARAAGVSRDKDKRERSASRDQPPQKRHRSNDKSRHGRDSRPPRDFGRDREDRWGGGGGGSRWGGSGGGGGGGGGRGGSRWGPRESRGPPAGGPNQSRFDRPWQPHGPPPPPRGGDFGGRGDRDNFRGGRGGGGGGGRPDRGGRGGGPPSGDRFGRDRPPRPSDRPDKRPHPSGGSGGGGGGNNNNGGASGGSGGGWQRGAPAPPGRAVQRGAQPGPPRGSKDGPNPNQNVNQANQQGWNQWAGGWGGWGNWGNQNPGWQNWGNWGNWNNANQASGGNNQAQVQGGQGAKGQGQAQGQNQQQQWPANYTAQQWYQWQQWQQQQQQAGWPGYQQGNQTGSQQDQAQAWAQYYQNYAGNANAGGATNAVTGGEKK